MSKTTYRELAKLTGQSPTLLWNLISRNRDRWAPKYDGRTAYFDDATVKEIVEFYSLGHDEQYLSLDQVLEQYPQLSLAKLRYNRRRYNVPPVKYGRNYDHERSRSVMYFDKADIEAFLAWDAHGRPTVARCDLWEWQAERGRTARLLFSDGTLVVMQLGKDGWNVDVDAEKGPIEADRLLMYERFALYAVDAADAAMSDTAEEMAAASA